MRTYRATLYAFKHISPRCSVRHRLPPRPRGKRTRCGLYRRHWPSGRVKVPNAEKEFDIGQSISNRYFRLPAKCRRQGPARPAPFSFRHDFLRHDSKNDFPATYDDDSQSSAALAGARPGPPRWLALSTGLEGNSHGLRLTSRPAAKFVSKH